MIKFTDKKLYLKGTAEAILIDKASGDIVYYSDKFQTANYQTSVTMGEIRAGLGNGIAAILPSDAAVNVNFTAADFSLAAKSLQVGAARTFGAPVMTCQTVTAAGTTLSLNIEEGAPVAALGMSKAVCWVQEVGAQSPIATDGVVEIETASGKKQIGIGEIHMEEDAGKLIHDIKEGLSHIDFNRAGVPLLEIVSRPDLRSAAEVEAYLERLKTLLRYARVAECEMAHGTMRCDVNLSVRPKGSETFGVRTEMKNMNSIEAIKRAIEYETARHIDILENQNGEILQETRRFDEASGKTVPMRQKETAGDYRYAPDPNLGTLVVDAEWIEQMQSTLPEFPEVKRERYVQEFGLSRYDAEQLTKSIALCECFEDAVSVCNSPKDAANWMTGEVLSLLNAQKMTPEMLAVNGKKLGELVLLVKSGKVGRANAKIILSALFEDATIDPAAYAKEKEFLISNDEEHIAKVVKTVVDADAKSVDDYKSGKEKALMFLFGKCMKELKGNCNPALLRVALTNYIAKL